MLANGTNPFEKEENMEATNEEIAMIRPVDHELFMTRSQREQLNVSC